MLAPPEGMAQPDPAGTNERLTTREPTALSPEWYEPSRRPGHREVSTSPKGRRTSIDLGARFVARLTTAVEDISEPGGCLNVREEARVQVFDVRDAVVDDYRDFTNASIQPPGRGRARFWTSCRPMAFSGPTCGSVLTPSFATGGTISGPIADGPLHPQRPRSSASRGIPPRALTEPTPTNTKPMPSEPPSRRVPRLDDWDRFRASRWLHHPDRGRHPQRSRGACGPACGVKAIIVSPDECAQRIRSWVNWRNSLTTNGDLRPQVTFRRYTGQETKTSDERSSTTRRTSSDQLRHIELVLTRPHERDALIRAVPNLRYLVPDELHSYRGRQGADVAMLVRRVRDACRSDQLDVIGTSATMASGSRRNKLQRIAETATLFFRHTGHAGTGDRGDADSFDVRGPTISLASRMSWRTHPCYPG